MYYLLRGFLWLLSLLPLRVLYFFSDCIYGLVYYVFKYRRDIVMQNLSIAFPEKTEKEKRVIAKKFYHNLIDTFIETIKMFSVSTPWLDRRTSFILPANRYRFTSGIISTGNGATR
jgi:KDO2-lipid IV(A) lauroyltransferase